MWVKRVLPIVLLNVGNDGLAYVTSTRDQCLRVRVRHGDHEGSLNRHRSDRRFLEILIGAVLRAIELGLLVYDEKKKRLTGRVEKLRDCQRARKG